MDRSKVRARQRLDEASARLLDEHPFHAHVLHRFELVSSTGIQSLAVHANSGHSICLIYNVEFVLSVALEELKNSLLHEVLHVIFGHIHVDLKQFKHRKSRVIAEEVTVNEFIHGPLPYDVPRIEDYGLPPLESTAKRYERLIELFGDDEPDADMSEYTLDDHTLWACLSEQAYITELIDGILEEECSRAGGYFWVLEAGIQEVLNQRLRRHGIDPASRRFAVQKRGEATIHWRSVLRRYVADSLQMKPTLAKPNRRFPNLIGIVPSFSAQRLKPKFLAVLDTSFSITCSPELVSNIDAELRGFARKYDVFVAESDAAVHRTYRYRPLDTIVGGGGTDLTRVFDRNVLQAKKPDLVIYFTDGHGPAPTRRPRCPVIWCIVPGGIKPTSWGAVLHIK